jgi:hypothetical protein
VRANPGESDASSEPAGRSKRARERKKHSDQVAPHGERHGEGPTASASPVIIQQNTSGTLATVGSGFSDGQSITTPAGGPWDDIGFNFAQCATPSGTSCLSTANPPFALGGLYLLTQKYDGLPSGLSSATPGFIAFTSTITGGVWTYAPGVTLNPSTQYFFYMDTAFDGPDVVYSDSNPYPGGQSFEANSGNGPTYGPDDSIIANEDHVFALTGNAVNSVPEPGTAALMVFGLAGLVGAQTLRRRRGVKG